MKQHAWVTIGINRQTCKVHIMGFAMSRTEAQQIGDERKNEEGGVDAWQVFMIDDDTGYRMLAWLKKKKIDHADSVEIIREVGAAVLEMIK